jgi:hypothetical protein
MHVVFALIVREPASECVCVFGGGGGGDATPPPPLIGSVTIYVKTTVQSSPGSAMRIKT